MVHLLQRLVQKMWRLAFGWLPLFIPIKWQRPGFLQLLWPHSLVSLVIIILGLSGSVYFGVEAAKGNELERVTTFAVPAPQPQLPKAKAAASLPRSEPTRLQIGSVGINTEVISVGRQADESMETPPLFSPVVGWYKYSPTPGEIGPAVIVGHVDTYKGPSVFWRLRELTPGTIIEVTRANKKTVKFKVDALKQFEQNNFPTSEVYGNIGHAGLRLITCGGSFNRKTGHYTQNTVVFASMIPETISR